MDACLQAISHHYRAEIEQSQPGERDRIKEAMLKEAELQKYTFLQEVFDQNRTLGKQYHQDLIALCIRFNRSKLMDVLKFGKYEKFEALKACQEAKLYKEQAYLNIMIGRKEEAVQLLIDSCSENINEVVDLAVQFHLSDDLLWD